MRSQYTTQRTTQPLKSQCSIAIDARGWLVLCLLALPVAGCSSSSGQQAFAASEKMARSTSNLPMPALAQPDPMSSERLREIQALYAPLMESNQALIREGKISEATERLLVFIPEARRTSAHHLYLGNVLYGLDKDASYRLHMEALRQQPDSASVNREAAMNLLRAGEGQKACPLFERYLDAHPDEESVHALWAYCLLEQGDAKRAIAAWRRAEHARNHVQIARMISAVFGIENPWAVRARLIEDIEHARDGNAAAELIRHDLNWRIDWWTDKPHYELAAEDAARFGGAHTAGLEMLVQAAREHRAPPTTLRESVRAELEQRAAFWPTALIRGLVDDGIRGEMLSTTEALTWLRETLEDRAFSAEGRTNDAQLLAALAQGQDGELLRRADTYCWARFRDARCGVSLFAGKFLAGKLALSDLVFRDALEKLSEEPILQLLALELTPQGSDEMPKRIERVILADFHRLLTSDPSLGRHTTYGIDSLFQQLEAAIAERPAKVHLAK